MPDPKREPTPGPWYVDPNNPTVIRHNNQNHKRRPAVALCGLTHGLGDARFEDEANARLIAAAPELLRAAEFTVEHFDKHGKIVGTLAIDSLRTAIAKARGDK